LNNLNDILNQELETIKQELIDKHISLKMKASGKWIDGLRVEISNKGGVLYGEDYTKQLVEGRPSGKFPPINVIKKWIIDKGLVYDIPLNSLTFLIARKIANSGTDYYIQGGTDLVSGVITDQRIDEILEKLENVIFKEIADIEFKVLKNVMKY
jgi:hypothetical protein